MRITSKPTFRILEAYLVVVAAPPPAWPTDEPYVPPRTKENVTDCTFYLTALCCHLLFAFIYGFYVFISRGSRVGPIGKSTRTLTRARIKDGCRTKHYSILPGRSVVYLPLNNSGQTQAHKTKTAAQQTLFCEDIFASHQVICFSAGFKRRFIICDHSHSSYHSFSH